MGYVQPEARRGRGATRSDAGRYERFEREAVDDGWDIPEELTQIRTEVREETPRSVMNYVQSPDLPFDRSVNPYRGCEHGCIYCFARPSHAHLGLSPGLDFETQLIARPGAAQVLDRELRSPRYKVAPVAIGTNTDAYQPIERDQMVMREILKVLQAFKHPVGIVTKGALIERDIDVLAPMAELGLVRVGISVTTLDPELSRRMEPRVPSPERRLKTVRRLTENGIPVRLMVSPVVPGLTDPEIENILEAGAQAGADAASWIMLRLPREVSGLWKEWLAEAYPEKVEKVMSKLRDMHGGQEYDPRWGHRMRGEGIYAELIAQRFRRAMARLGLRRDTHALRCDLFEPPFARGAQMGLF